MGLDNTCNASGKVKREREQVTKAEILDMFKSEFEQPVPCAITWATKARLNRWIKKHGVAAE